MGCNMATVWQNEGEFAQIRKGVFEIFNIHLSFIKYSGLPSFKLKWFFLRFSPWIVLQSDRWSRLPGS